MFDYRRKLKELNRICKETEEARKKLQSQCENEMLKLHNEELKEVSFTNDSEEIKMIHQKYAEKIKDCIEKYVMKDQELSEEFSRSLKSI